MTADTYTNPVAPGYFADPFLLRDGDTWYAYGTGLEGDAAAVDDHNRVFEVRRSTDLVHWESLGCALEPPDDLPEPEPGAHREFWAPEVVARDGRWLMYYSTGIEDRGHRLRVATADAPAGPFVDAGVELAPAERFAIDPDPFRDDDGT